jgi:hypothetical protein
MARKWYQGAIAGALSIDNVQKKTALTRGNSPGGAAGSDFQLNLVLTNKRREQYEKVFAAISFVDNLCVG